MFQQLSLFDSSTNAPIAVEEINSEVPISSSLDLSNLTKLYYSIGEVANLFNVNSSLLRFWEKEFPHLFSSLKKNKKGDRFYTKKEIDALKTLFYLIKEKKMTLEGARDYLKKNKTKLKEDKTLLENLKKVKEFLVDLKKNIQ